MAYKNKHTGVRTRTNTSRPFSDMDFLLFLLGFCFYITTRFVVESGWIFGSILVVSAFFSARKSSDMRHKIYLYTILIFTSIEEQNWLMRKFSLNSRKSHRGPKNDLDESRFNDAINQTLNLLWPFVKGFIEEKVKGKVRQIIANLSDNRAASIFQNLLDFRMEEIEFGTKTPLIHSLRVFPSHKGDVIVYGVGFKYIGDSSLVFSTNLAKFRVEDIKAEGCLRVEIGRLEPHPPFLGNIRVCLTDYPKLDFSVSNLPSKFRDLVRIVCLEATGSRIVMPQALHLPLSPPTLDAYFPPGVLLINIIRAQDLPNKETFKLSDPFCIIRLAAEQQRTTVIKNSLNPRWNFMTEMICVEDPTKGDFDLHLTIYDKDLVLNDVLYRSKLSVRKVMEEGFVEEWLQNEGLGDSKALRGKGEVHIMVVWRSLLEGMGEMIAIEDEKSSCSYNDAFMNPENLENKTKEGGFTKDSRINSGDLGMEIPQMNKCSKELTQFRRNFFQAILLVWLESLEGMEPTWEDFRIELKLGNISQRTSFFPRDPIKQKWHIRQRILLPMVNPSTEELSFKIISRSNSRWVRKLTFCISNLIRTPNQNGVLQELYLRGRNEQEFVGVMKLSFAWKRIERISNQHLASLAQVEMDSYKERVVNTPTRDVTPTRPILNHPDNEVQSVDKPHNPSVFKITELGWDMCLPFTARPSKADTWRKSPTNSHRLMAPRIISEEQDNELGSTNAVLSPEHGPDGELRRSVSKRGSKRWLILKNWPRTNNSLKEKKS